MSHNRPQRLGKWVLRAYRRRWALWAASLPLLQATGCFPDVLGALNFQGQLLVNTVLINALSTVVQNIFGL